MKIIYMGTPEFAVPPLEALYNAGHELAAVFTQPDRPKGRGMKMVPPPVKELAEKLGIPVYQPETLRGYAARPILEELKPDLIAVAAYGKLLPPYILKNPPLGCINVHASLLPKYRGAAPIQHAIMNGETRTGVTIMHMAREIDNGDMIISGELEIGRRETAGELTERLSKLGAELLVEVLKLIEAGTAPRTEQEQDLSTYAPPITRDDARIDWNANALQIADRIRAMLPAPGAFTTSGGNVYKLADAAPVQVEANTNTVPGTVLGLNGEGHMIVRCGGGVVAVAEIQAPGKRRMAVSDYIRGNRLPEKFD